MSRLLDSWNHSRFRSGTPPDSEPVLLGPEASTQLAPTSKSNETHEDGCCDSVPFIEIPEPADTPGPTPSRDREAKSELRFEAYQNGRADIPSSRSTTAEPSPDSSPIAEYRPAVTALWQKLQHGRAASLLLLSLEQNTNDPVALLWIAQLLREHASSVLLVEVTHTSGLSDKLGRAEAPGWNDWLAGLPLDAVVQSTDLSGLHYLAPGHNLAAAQRRFWSWDWQARLAELRKHYSLVLWWTAVSSCWAFPLAMLADATCFLTRRAITPGFCDSLVQALCACSQHCLGWFILRP